MHGNRRETERALGRFIMYPSHDGHKDRRFTIHSMASPQETKRVQAREDELGKKAERGGSNVKGVQLSQRSDRRA